MILDTCALLWLVNGDAKLSRATFKKINEEPFIHISAISGFEVAYKAAKGQLTLQNPAEEWFRKAVDRHGLTILPLDLTVCIMAAQLPPIHHDPCDRFIIATAKLNNLAVVTADERFEEYGVKTLL